MSGEIDTGEHPDMGESMDRGDAEENHGPKGSNIPERVAALLQQAKSLQSTATALSSRIKVEEQVLSNQALVLEKDMRRLRSDVFLAVEKEEIIPQLAEKLEEEIDRAHWMICEGDVGALLPHKYNGFFLRMLLGPVNVRASRNDVRFKVKEEYNAYRDRTAILFLLFPSILLLLRNWLWKGCFPALPVQAYQAWLLFFYTSLALRENILRINGSDIRPWWVYHHYCAMLMAVVSLTWDFKGERPYCERKQNGVKLFLVWAVMQGVAMLLQNRYQRQRLYTRIALGKAGRMDVVWGETAGVIGQLWLLYPLLFVLQLFQGYIGILLLLTAFIQDDCEWQVITSGILLLIMAAGNFANTFQTLLAKRRIKLRKGKNPSQKTAVNGKDTKLC
ncbi:hypothetical protein KP509_09G092800 [Ceratopteris richardii]|uniref:TMPIT-like protein n=1 Tax=Ceratopteris richardii TaxID=49495 RepID=A0A8T2U6X9_CERRI|nr:hypothetical protein KP509_09G092800 [Ceratopteris richardii]KAH7430308.1 hypothetical protein KP509_09G092800 [Ceratopteris richardii]KAH7430309.1 hypothetical protein KP509_09G092800 [Ceratopteris richardii]KAH7430310.1 hypothetical protein KP509_09G092800 [Ceratopteris richardii]